MLIDLCLLSTFVAFASARTAQWFTNLLDHFDNKSTATFQQKFYVNTTFENANATSNVPTFIFLGGKPLPYNAATRKQRKHIFIIIIIVVVVLF